MPRENSFSDSDGRSLTPDLPEAMDEFDEPNRKQRHNALPSPVLVSPTYSTRSPIAQGENGAPRVLVQSSTSQQANSPVNRPPGLLNGGWSHLTPKERFRMAARRVMAIKRSATLMSRKGQAGAEPGVDPRRASADLLYSHIHQECIVEIFDYSSLRSNAVRMTNTEFIEFMSNETVSMTEPWVKVRWINIAGMSWDVIKAVSIRYGIHPLALEDVFQTRGQTRSKVDYYTKHLFLRVLCHELEAREKSDLDYLAGKTRSASPEPMVPEYSSLDDEKPHAYEDENPFNTPPHHPVTRKRPLLPTSRKDLHLMFNRTGPALPSLIKTEKEAKKQRQRRLEEKASLEAIKRGEGVKVKVSPVFIFLFRDGTVISMQTTPNLSFTAPISHRLRQSDTVLRTSADPSLLVHSLLDLIVDKALDVVDEYHNIINKCERDIMLKPQIKHVRQLHILSGDLILHKRTLEPIKTLVYGLRRYDVDRCAALIDTSDTTNALKVVGFMSHKSKIYLADVFDHMDYILSSLNMYAGISENLINYTFNLASHEMNEVMRRLTLATIIFLPLTLLTGYFGMNFEAMWSVKNHSDLFFWEIAIPLMIVLVPIFIWPDLRRLGHYVKKRAVAQSTLRVHRSRHIKND
ncbi:hypothetical protein AX17_000425 [Amanita inopinata Kibby_2008]|nr:hypothetical protein AX17_000425 [Amanita inopinata Kibby_2008]